MLIDTHVHLVYRERLSYSWLSGAPALDRDWHYKDYARIATRLGISGALHMEVDVDTPDIDAETQLIADLIEQDSSLLLGAISSARPEDEGFDVFLDSLDTHTVKGIRRVLHTMPDDISQSTLFRDNIRKLGAKGLPFDICVLARQLDLATKLVDAAEDTVFVLDHCGVPDIAGGDFKSWADSITEISKRDHVNAKISGITAYGPADWTLETLRPYVHHIIESFGWDRLVWGSDSPVCTLQASLEQWIAATHALTLGASKDELAKFHRANATRIWRL